MNTSSITQLTEDCIAVVVPKSAKNITILNNTLRWKTNALKFWWDQKPFSPGQWEILGKGDSLNEDQWKGIATQVVGWISVIYHNHTASGRDYRDIVEAAFSTATESGLSLLKSKGLKPENTLILKRKA